MAKKGLGYIRHPKPVVDHLMSISAFGSFSSVCNHVCIVTILKEGEGTRNGYEVSKGPLIEALKGSNCPN